MMGIKEESLLAGGGFQGTHLVDANWKGFPEMGPEGGSRLAGHNWRRDPNQTPEKMLIMQCHQSTRAVDPPCLMLFQNNNVFGYAVWESVLQTEDKVFFI